MQCGTQVVHKKRSKRARQSSKVRGGGQNSFTKWPKLSAAKGDLAAAVLNLRFAIHPKGSYLSFRAAVSTVSVNLSLFLTHSFPSALKPPRLWPPSAVRLLPEA